MASNFSQVKSLQLRSGTEEEILIEGLSSRGLAHLRIMGLPDSWLRECKDKIQSLAAKTVGWDALARVLIHILPEEEDKIGAHLELPIVLACLIALRKAPLPASSHLLLTSHYFIGALGLDGKLRSTPSLEALYANSPRALVGPKSYARLENLWEDLQAGKLRSEQRPGDEQAEENPPELCTEGRIAEKQWLMLAAVARLPVLLCGIPGAGKSHLARWAHSLCPFYNLDQPRLSGRGARVEAPHSKVNLHQFLGISFRGASRPGIFANAHQGLLILDEFAELNRDVRETLRTVLDRKQVSYHHQGRPANWPADFWLIATTNPCPCGYAKPLDPSHCRCSNGVMQNYGQRVSGPVFERFGVKLFLDLDEIPREPIAHLPTTLTQLQARRPLRSRSEARLAEILEGLRETFPRLSFRDLKNKSALAEAYERLTERPFTEFLPELHAALREESGLFRFREQPFPRVFRRATGGEG